MTAVTSKLLITTFEAWSILPGRGQAIFRKFLGARWISPCSGGRNPLYRTADVQACLRRMEQGERPEPVHVWKAAIGGEGRPVAHVVPAAGNGKKRAACGCGSEWFSASPGMGRCPRCAGLAKTLRVEDA